MKSSYIPTSLIIIFLISFSFCFAQTKDYPVQISLGVNVIDVYPTGVSSQGGLFEDFFNIQDHWNFGSVPLMVQVTKYLGRGFSFGGRGSYNTITKYGATSANDPFYNADGIIKYNWSQILKTKRVSPYFEIGGGYAIFDKVGAGYFNLGAGIEYWLGEKGQWGITVGSLFRNTGETFGTKHFQHYSSLTYRFENRDRDGDGILNRDDDCPDTPGLPSLNGCPDSDLDGIRDLEDKCIDVPGIPALEGCPDTDNDGIQDNLDKCPELWGIQKFEGCPDTDGDGIEDAEDECVNMAGVVENNGCPEEIVKIEEEKLPQMEFVVYDETKLIYFNSDMYSLNYESILVLNEIAKVLLENPSFKIEINGHTDSTYKETYNQRLSEQRALTAKKYLIVKDIDPNRIKTAGFGEREPVRSNDTKEGRALNRRTEIIIIK